MGSLHHLLDDGDLDILKLKNFLENDSSSINDKNNFGETALLKVLVNENCSEEIVELFLKYGANPHISDCYGETALMAAILNGRGNSILRLLIQRTGDMYNNTDFQSYYGICLQNYLCWCDDCSVEIVKLFIEKGAKVNHFLDDGSIVLVEALHSCKDKEIIRALLAAGADPNLHERFESSPLCLALSKSYSVDVIKMLLNAGSSLNGCMRHGSVLHCATNKPTSGVNEDVLRLLLQSGADVRRVNTYGQSILCFVIPITENINCIKLLLNAGVPLSDCSKHSSPLLCATDVTTTCNPSTPLTEDMVNLLVGEGASVDVVNSNGLTPLELALQHRCYETQAIILLFNLQIEVNKSPRWIETILHFALSNSLCKTSALQFLINNGARLDKADASGKSPLELALERTISTYEGRDNVSFLRMLLVAGARVDSTLLLKYLQPVAVYSGFRECPYMLLKYACLQNPAFDISEVHQVHYNIEEMKNFAVFASRCLKEVNKMEAKTFGDSRSFRKFLTELYLPREIADDRYRYFNLLLKMLIADDFPLFFDVISAKIGRDMMKMKLNVLQVYTVKRTENVRVILDYDTVCNIAKYLSDDDLLRLILAFHKDDNEK